MDEATFNKILAAGLKHGASDIHFTVALPPSYRVKGTLVPIKAEKLNRDDTVDIVRLLLRANPEIDIKNIKDLDTSYSLPGLSRFRVCLFRQRGSYAIVMRIIPQELPTIESLVLPDVIRKIAGLERGLVLITGVTGSGKTSTLAAIINEINSNRTGKHIITIEDPIEFLHPHKKCTISQREVGHDTGSFSGALRSALRQDPDIILVGEMRDYETTDTAVKAAETGHFVLSTVHTTDAAKTINRILSIFPTEEQILVRYRLADCLGAIISQRLLPRLNGSGRIVAAEILLSTTRVRDYIMNPEKTESLNDVLNEGFSQYGMQSFDLHLSQLYQKKLISLETARSAATNAADFERALSFE